MKSFLFVVYVLGLPALAIAPSNIRPVDAASRDTLAQLLARSATARELVGGLSASDLIIHIESAELMGNGLGGMTRFAATRGGYRYVRITILRTLPSNERAAILGHELQHATEIACSPASTAAAVRALFNRIGQAVAGARDVFETRAAEEVTASVWLELHGRREQRTTDKGRRTERRTWN